MNHAGTLAHAPKRYFFAAKKKSSAFFYSWGELRDLCRPSSLNYSLFYSGTKFGWESANDRLTEEAIRYLHENETDFAFLYLGYPDNAGHASGWMGEEYMHAMDNSWENIGRFLDAADPEEALIITADHGGHDRTHGTPLPEDMTIPLIFAGAERSLIGDLSGASIMDIAPTLAALAGISPEEDWEGKSLLA